MYDDCANGAGNLAKKSRHNNSFCFLHTQAGTLKTQRENCVWKKIILHPTTSETVGRTGEW